EGVGAAGHGGQAFVQRGIGGDREPPEPVRERQGRKRGKMTTAIAQALSVALLHFVWQGILTAFLLWAALAAMRNRSANARYAASCVALAALVAMPVITAGLVYRAPAAGTEQIVELRPFTASPAAAAAAVRPSPVSTSWLAVWQSWAVPV